MLRLWLAQLLGDGYVELHDSLALVKTLCTISETTISSFQELLSSSSSSSLDVSETFQGFCSFLMSTDKGLQEVHIFLLWSQGDPQLWRISMWVYSVIYIISRSSYPSNILKFIDNRHWTPSNVYCLMYNVWFLSSDSAFNEWWCILLCLLTSHPLHWAGQEAVRIS